MAASSLCLLLVVGLLTWWLVAGDDGPYVAPVPDSPPATVEPDGASRTLQLLARAVSGGDRAAAEALAGPEDGSTATRLGDLASTAAAARLSDVSFRYVTEDGGVAGDGTWAASVDVTWAYAGFDRAPTSAEVQVRFRAGADGVTIAGLGSGSTSRVPVWMSGPVQVERSGGLLLVVAAGRDPDTYEESARAAVPTVSSVLTAWRPRLVVEVPSDGAALERALGAEPGYYSQIAAVTGSEGAVVQGSPIHVYVNPDVFDGLGRTGQDVVLAHEATHVATAAPLSRAPTWLVEGFADYVALRTTTLPLSRTAAQVAAQVRRGGLPRSLPTPKQFDTRGPHLGAVYESSWLLCVTLAQRGGPAALERLYDDVGGGEELAVALRRGFRWSEADLVAAWRDRLAALPRPA